jgi:hypothetical protein
MMPADNFSSFGDVPAAPAQHIFLISPGSAPLVRVTKAIRAGSDGSITLRAAGDAGDVVHPVLAGELVIARISHVTAASPAMTIVGYA